MNAGRSSVHCLTSNALGADVAGMLDSLESVGSARLDVTQKIIDNLERESGLAAELGYDPYAVNYIA